MSISMTIVAWLWIALSIAAALVLSALIWLAGPLVYFGEAQPFESVGVRLTVILLILLIVGGTRLGGGGFRAAGVLMAPAGGYAPEDSDAKVERRSWLAFLDMLGKNRPRQPINGVIIAISIADVLSLSAAESAAHADAIRKRLAELHEELKVDFPVYAIFTKMDLIVGFTQYFADLAEPKRESLWASPFHTSHH